MFITIQPQLKPSTETEWVKSVNRKPFKLLPGKNDFTNSDTIQKFPSTFREMIFSRLPHFYGYHCIWLLYVQFIDCSHVQVREEDENHSTTMKSSDKAAISKYSFYLLKIYVWIFTKKWFHYCHLKAEKNKKCLEFINIPFKSRLG